MASAQQRCFFYGGPELIGLVNVDTCQYYADYEAVTTRNALKNPGVV